ncbi:ankyrin repeat-containing domain protein [Phyllosticta citrichinensis]|uniref:Ankyrin repeat-containing domain protein n=1 Tax=Phyllosticta citrichinensis TaxID=1130410 RepID=A0ABR1Y1C7_9PEZI
MDMALMSSIYIGNKNEEAFTELVELVGNCGGRLNKQDLDALERRYDRAGKIGLVFKAIIEDWVPESSRGRLIGLKKKAKARQQEYQETDSGESDFHKAAYPQEDPEELLWHAVTLDQEETLRGLLRHPDVDIDAVNRSGQTALHQAISEGSLKVLRVLLESGANVHKIDLEVQTPLHQCSQNGSTEGLAWILEAGADLSAVGELGCNIWHLAAKPDNLEILKALFLLKGNPQDFLGLKCFQGLTPIFHALASSSVDSLVFLMQQTEDWKKDWIFAQSLLELFQSKESYYWTDGTELEYLGRLSDNVICRKNFGFEALKLAIDSNDSDLVRLLLSKAIPPNRAKSQAHLGPTPLEIACRRLSSYVKSDPSDIFELLLQATPASELSQESVTEEGGLVHHLCGGHVLHDSLLEQLLQKGVDVDARDSFGKTALMKAAEINKPEHVASLLRHDADPGKTDTNGWNCLHYAASWGAKEFF